MGVEFACAEWAIIRNQDDLFFMVMRMKELKGSSEMETEEVRERWQAVRGRILRCPGSGMSLSMRGRKRWGLSLRMLKG